MKEAFHPLTDISPGQLRFYPQDQEGLLLPLQAPVKLQKPFHRLLPAVIRIFERHLGEALIGVYLRGSVAQGTALKGISDFDSFAVVSEEKLQRKVRWEDLESVEQERLQLVRKYPSVSQVEMMITSYDEQKRSLDPRIAVMMACQSVCVWGQDLIPDLPRLRVGPALMLNLRWIEEVAPALRSYRAGKLSQERLDSALKTLIRAAFEAIMPRLGRYSTDLFTCCHAFESFYPERAHALWMAREIFMRRAEVPGHYWTEVEALAGDQDFWTGLINDAGRDRPSDSPGNADG